MLLSASGICKRESEKYSREVLTPARRGIPLVDTRLHFGRLPWHMWVTGGVAMAGHGRIYQRGQVYFIAYSVGGREFRESARSPKWEDAKARLEQRLHECAQ